MPKLIWTQTWRNYVINMQINMWRHLPPQVSQNPVGNTESPPNLLHHLAEFCLQINVTSAGKMSQNAHELISSYRQKKWKMLILVEFEVFTKMSSLSPLLAIPMLQIVFKHLNIFLFACFLRGVPFLRSLLALTVIRSERITALLTVCDPNKYTQNYSI